MADRSKWFEVVISICGIAVTALLGFGQFEQTSRQQQEDAKHEADNIEVQVISLVAPHLVNLAKQDADSDASEKVVLAAAEYLTTQYSRAALATMAAKITEGNKSVPPELLTRIQEATEAVPAAGKYFVVIATFARDDLTSAKTRANAFLPKVQEQAALHGAQVQIYQATVSNSLVVVLAGPAGQLEKATARDYVTVARVSFASDAYTQHDRQWIPQGAAPFAL